MDRLLSGQDGRRHKLKTEFVQVPDVVVLALRSSADDFLEPLKEQARGLSSSAKSHTRFTLPSEGVPRAACTFARLLRDG